jgi:hypothetical protein
MHVRALLILEKARWWLNCFATPPAQWRKRARHHLFEGLKFGAQSRPILPIVTNTEKCE